MVADEDISIALNELYRQLGTQKALAERAGITQSTINAYLNGKAKIRNMPVGVFTRLFQEMTIHFFGSKTARSDELLQTQLLEIFNTLPDAEKIACVAYVAKNFGGQMPERDKR